MKRPVLRRWRAGPIVCGLVLAVAEMSRAARAESGPAAGAPVAPPRRNVVAASPSAALSPNAVPILRQPNVVLEGILEVITVLPAPDDPNPREQVDYYLRRGRERLRLRLPPAVVAGIEPRARIRVRGTRIVYSDGTAELVVGDTVGVDVLAEAPAVPTTGNRHTILILFNFLDNDDELISPQALEAALASDPRALRPYYLENSLGQLTLSSDVVGWYTIPFESNDRCDYGAWADAATAAAEADNVDLESYAQITYVFPHSGSGAITSCAFGGLGEIGGTRAWVQIYPLVPFDFFWRTLSHEFGHNLGLGHASGLDCGEHAIDAYANCILQEYGDPFDVMGGQYFLFNAPHKIATGWIGPAAILPVTDGGVYAIAPLGSDRPGTEVLRIDKPDTSEEYYLSYRVPTGTFDTTFDVPGLGSNEGVAVHVSSAAFGRKTYALTALPGQSFTLLDGTSFVDATNDLTVTQLAHDADSATLSVRFGPPPVGTPTPAVTATPDTAATPVVGFAPDAVVVPPKPVSAIIRAGVAAARRNVRVRVVNAAREGTQAIRLEALDGTCPAGTVAAAPDFDSGAPRSQDTVLLRAGRKRAAVVPLTISAAAFTGVNPHAPTRCTLTLSATALPNGGPADATPANDTVPLELNVVDLNDVPRAAADGSLVMSAAPVRMGIRKGASLARKTIALRVRRADIETALAESHILAVTLADGDCPPGTVGLDPAPEPTRALERLVTISGTRALRVPVTLAVDAAAFRAASKRSPARCTARFTASAATGDVVAGEDGDPIVTGAALSNDATTVVIDVVDYNDF